MRHARWWIGSLVFTAVLASSAEAQHMRFHVSPTVGFFLFDDDALSEEFGVEVEPAVVLGARAGYAFAPSWQVEGAYGYAPLSTEPAQFQQGDPEVELADIDAHLLYAAVNYLLTYAETPTALLLSAGGGFMILNPEVGDSATDPMLDFGVGFTHPLSDWITIRGEARDHIVFCGAPDFNFDFSACPVDDEMLHNFEVSASLQFWLY